MPVTNKRLRFPAEWESQSGVMLTWPHQYSDWQPLLTEIEPIYLSLCKAITEYQSCLLLCYDQSHYQHISRLLENNAVNLDYCQLVVCQTNDTWCRDYAPLTIEQNGIPILQDFIFNGWGNKYDAQLDNETTMHLQSLDVFKGTTINNHNWVLEGGSLDSDGAGTILTTSTCLLKRHPDLNKNKIEDFLQHVLGCERILWLDHGRLCGDDTDSHIDNLARFVDVNTIIYLACDDRRHKDYVSLQNMLAQLQEFRKLDGSPYKLIPLPLPVLKNEEVLPASYVNFLIINGAVLVPLFDQTTDEIALATMRKCFPDRKTIGINANALIKQYGGIHCATMQFPQGILTPGY